MKNHLTNIKASTSIYQVLFLVLTAMCVAYVTVSFVLSNVHIEVSKHGDGSSVFTTAYGDGDGDGDGDGAGAGAGVGDGSGAAAAGDGDGAGSAGGGSTGGGGATDPIPSCTLVSNIPSITLGQSVVLSWLTSDATAVTLNQGIGSVALSGVNGVSPIVTTTYTLTATGPGGVVTCADTVTVTPAPIVVTPLPVCDAFTTAPSSMSDAGPVSLVWDTSLATIVTIDNGVGNVVLDGSTNVNVAADTTFTLTATNGAQSVTCQASVDISAVPVVPPVVPGGGGGNGGGGSNSPRCELTASNQNIKPGDSVNLSWKNSNTNDLLLVNNFGNTLIDTRRSTTIDEDAGSIRVSPSRTTTYTLTAIRGSRDRECTVTVSVISLSSNRMQDSISLSKTPYTGFEAGAALTFIFYAGIVLWGLTVAYVLVMKNNPTIFTRTTSGAAPIKSYETAPLNELDFTLGSTFLPHNLPTEELEHSEQIDDVHTETDSISLLEERAHEQYALISSDALRLIEGQSGVTEDQVETLDRVIALAKARYPKENEWIVINKERVMSLLS